MMDELIRHIDHICATDWQTIAIILLFCGTTTLALKEYVAAVLAVLAVPLLFVSSVLIHYSFVLGQIYVPNKLDQWLMWTVLASIGGNMMGIALIAAIGRLRDRAVPLGSSAKAARGRQGIR